MFIEIIRTELIINPNIKRVLIKLTLDFIAFEFLNCLGKSSEALMVQSFLNPKWKLINSTVNIAINRTSNNT